MSNSVTHPAGLSGPAPRLRQALQALSLVFAAHVFLLWALLHGLHQRPEIVMVPTQILVQVLPPPPVPLSPPRPAPQPAQPVKASPLPAAPKPATPLLPVAPVAPAVAAAPAPASPAPTPTPTPTPSPTPAFIPSSTPALPPPSPSVTTSVPSTPAQAVAPAPGIPSSPAPVQLPSTQADYLQNPKPAYPPLSLRLGESGRAVYRVWIGPDGRAQKAELVKSSGFPRLDKATFDAVMVWRYVPGKRGGVAELMAFDVPISWELPN